ncbi:MAG: PstS family phosphate ABC transporter substrate-binding protein [Sedimentisphaerales bacterium]|nr:PstS family phosphate ABC transporter substrate-binding protein [Sedimentisphaerales bacterium]
MKTDKNQKSRGSDMALIVTVCLIIMFAGIAGGAAEKKMVTVKGSDTMVHLVSHWAEWFMKQRPDVEAAVTGGGSGTGIAALINGTTEICASSREMKDKEKQQAKAKGVEVKEIVVARDGIAVVVNPQNPVSELDMEQLGGIFTGSLTKWNQVGGVSDKEILVFSRESSSGTYVFFQEHVLKNKDYAVKAKLMPATSAIIEAVASDADSIGYVGLGYAQAAKDKVRVIGVKADANLPAVMPSEETVISGKYPIARPLYLYVSIAAREDVTAFAGFCLSKDGQEIVRQEGYVTVK